MKLDSIFGVYSQRLQVLIDQKLDKFAPTLYQRFFDWAPAQTSLTFTSVRGEARIEAAASVVDRNSTTPLRSRPTIKKAIGDIPAIKEMRSMNENDYRDFLSLQSMNVDNSTKLNQLLDLMFNDVKVVGNAAHKRLDIFTLEGLSTGYITLSTTNNPDGIVLTQLDLLMPSGNRVNAGATWATAVSAKPITDIQDTVKAASDKGIKFGKILMSLSLFNKFRVAKEVVDTMQAFYYGKTSGSINPIAITTLDNINSFLSANILPPIEVIDAPIGIESDGVISTIRPFNENVAVFIPDGKLGVIKNALAIEQIAPVEKCSYGIFNRALISKWKQNEPFSEFTKVELNACPSFDMIDYVYILTAIL